MEKTSAVEQHALDTHRGTAQRKTQSFRLIIE